MILKKYCKPFVAVLMAFTILFTGFTTSYHKAYATGGILEFPAGGVGIGLGYVFLSIGAMMGIGVAIDKKEQIEELMEPITDQLIEYAHRYEKWEDKTVEQINQEIDRFVTDCQDGVMDIRDDVAQMIKDFIMDTEIFVSAEFPDWYEQISDANIKADVLTGNYPYYFKGREYTSAASQLVFISSIYPLLYYEVEGATKNTIRLEFVQNPDTGEKWSGYYYSSSSGEWDGKLNALSKNTSYAWYMGSLDIEHALQYIDTNMPIFNSRDAALEFHQNFVIDGVIPDGITTNDIPWVTVPDLPADIVWPNTDLISDKSYINSDGQVVVNGDVTMPTWQDLINVGNGVLTWDDIMDLTGVIPIVVPEEDEEEITGDVVIPIPNPDPDPEDPDKKPTLNDILPVIPDRLPDILAALTTIFPFCIPFDLIDCIKILSKEGKAPVFKIPFKVDFQGRTWVDEEFVIDMAEYETLVVILRAFLILSFIVGLIMITRAFMIKS